MDTIIALYDAEISYMDHHLGKLLEEFDKLCLKNNTIIIITSDHGEEFYEHGFFSHEYTLYQPATQVPRQLGRRLCPSE